MGKISTERKIDNDTFKIKVGSTNKNHPETFYIDLTTNVSLNDGYSNKKINEINKSYKKIANEIIIDNDFDKNFILDVDLSEDSLKKKGSAFFSAQIFMKQRKYNKFNDIYDRISASLSSKSNEFSDALTSVGFEIVRK